MPLEQWHLVVAGCALIGPAIFLTGVFVGTIRGSVRGAHRRIDKLDNMLATGFEGLRDSLGEAIREGWRHCPLAQRDTQHK